LNQTGADLVDQHVGQLVLERLRVAGAREVAALGLAALADRLGDAPHGLGRRDLGPRLGHAGLPEVLRDEDVGRELAPGRGDLDLVHLEHDRAVGVRDHRAPLLEADVGRRVGAGLGEASAHLETARALGLVRDLYAHRSPFGARATRPVAATSVSE